MDTGQQKTQKLKETPKLFKDKMTIYNKRKMSKVFRAKNIQELEGENMGLYVDFGSESEDEEQFYKQAMEKEDEEVRDDVRCHPMPSPDDKEGEQFWKKVIDRMKSGEGVKDMTIYMFVNFAIIKKMYENLTDKQVIIDCGKELNRDGKFNAMIINITLLSIATDELNDTNKPCLTQMRVIEHWWDGIGKWKA